MKLMSLPQFISVIAICAHSNFLLIVYAAVDVMPITPAKIRWENGGVWGGGGCRKLYIQHNIHSTIARKPLNNLFFQYKTGIRN